MTGQVPSATILKIETCVSTNDEAMRLAAAGEMGPLWVLARNQDRGRGRAGRAWRSFPDNLQASYLTHLAGPVEHPGQLSLVAGVAIAQAIDALVVRQDGGGLHGRVWLKWPNDIMLGDAKLGGVLVETMLVRGGPGRGSTRVVIGIGLNLAVAPDVQDRPTVCFRAARVNVSPEQMLGFLDPAMERGLGAWDCGRGFANVRELWLTHGCKVGVPISVHDGESVLQGAFVGLADDGYLRIRLADGSVEVVGWGDVEVS